MERLTKKQRHETILREIHSTAAIRISKLAKRIGVSGETIRRDLIELGEAGLVNRTYGGATISLVSSEPTVSDRVRTSFEERGRIGRAVAGLVKDGQVVLVDGGSTTYQVVVELAQASNNLTIITNSANVMAAAAVNASFRVVLCPGVYEKREGSVFGEDTVEFIRRYNADHAVIGASGLAVDGPSELIPGAAAVKRAMIARARSATLVVTSDKFDQTSLERVCSLNEINRVVTDAEPPAGLRAAIAGAGVELLVS